MDHAWFFLLVQLSDLAGLELVSVVGLSSSWFVL